MALDPAYEDFAQTQGRLLAEQLRQLELALPWQHSPAQADRIMRELTDAIGLSALQASLSRQTDELVARAKDQGLTTHSCSTITVTVLQGTLEVESPYLYDRRTGRSWRPLKDHFGLWGDSRSDCVEQALSEFGAHESFRHAQQRFERHYPARVGDSAPRDATLGVAAHARDFVEQTLDEMAQAYDVPPAKRSRAREMLVESDGCLLRTGEFADMDEALDKARQRDASETELERLEELKANGAQRCRILIWREVHSGLARRKEQRLPSVVARHSSRHQAVSDLFGLACGHGLSFDTEVLAIGDGGTGLKSAFEEHFAKLDYLLDWRHMEVEHLQETAGLLGMREEAAQRWASVHMERMARGEALSVLGELQSQYEAMKPEEDEEPAPGVERLGKLVKYVEKYIHCVAYDQWRQAGWPIGSSEVENLHKRLIQKRMKLAGACWKEENLDPMLALRTAALNDGWWEAFWEWEHQRRQDARKKLAAS